MENDILTVNCPYCGCKYEFDQSEYKVLSFYCAFCRVDVYIDEIVILNKKEEYVKFV